MNVLIFSDTHLCLPFDQKKFDFLEKIISSSDRVIINGDFFDHYMISFDNFIKSPWNGLFPILKRKKAVYIYGNHDEKEFSDNRVDLFSIRQTYRLKLEIDNKVFIFEHGQKIRTIPGILLTINRKLIYLTLKIGHYFRNLMVKLFGKLFIILRFSYRNIKSKRKIINFYKPGVNEVYIIGHNHFGEVDEKNHFAVSGMILYGFAQYLTIDSAAKITLHEEWYDK